MSQSVIKLLITVIVRQTVLTFSQPYRPIQLLFTLYQVEEKKKLNQTKNVIFFTRQQQNIVTLFIYVCAYINKSDTAEFNLLGRVGCCSSLCWLLLGGAGGPVGTQKM